MNIQIFTDTTKTQVENTIIADEAFAKLNFPGRWKIVPEQPVAPPPEVIQPYEWFIDIGPFFDRFGDTKMSILTSPDPGIKAILADIQIRKWIDLKRTDVATSLAYIGSIIPALTQSKQNMIMNVIPSDEENLALRKLYFS
jgi:hypothetical protein